MWDQISGESECSAQLGAEPVKGCGAVWKFMRRETIMAYPSLSENRPLQRE